jgi:hypothetical protein
MMLRLPRLSRPRDPVAISIFAWKTAIVILTILTSIFSFLAALDAQSAKCAGNAWLVGYRSGISDFAAFPLISGIMAVAFIVVLTTEKVKQRVLRDEREIFAFKSVRFTNGMFLFCVTLFCGLIIFGIPARFSVERYSAIAAYCGSVASN